jgi:hypothetical protein
MTSRAGWTVVTALFVLAISAATAGAPGVAPERECERNGGYWVTATGHCKIGA